MKKVIYTIIGIFFTLTVTAGATWLCCMLSGVQFTWGRALAAWIALYCMRCVINYHA